MTHNSTDCSGTSLVMSEFCDFRNWPMCTELTIMCSINKATQKL